MFVSFLFLKNNTLYFLNKFMPLYSSDLFHMMHDIHHMMTAIIFEDYTCTPPMLKISFGKIHLFCLILMTLTSTFTMEQTMIHIYFKSKQHGRVIYAPDYNLSS